MTTVMHQELHDKEDMYEHHGNDSPQQQNEQYQNGSGMSSEVPESPSTGVITTHCVSSAILPGRRSANDPLQFVKIQAAELSIKAKEQIRLAEEVKITKEKIKEVEEEWQSNLLNWKSKRKVNHGSLENEDEGNNTGDENCKSNARKVKTFSEILNEKAKSGQRIGYNLHRYGYEAEEDDDISSLIRSNNNDNNSTNDTETSSSLESDEQMISQSINGLTASSCEVTSLNREEKASLIKSDDCSMDSTSKLNGDKTSLTTTGHGTDPNSSEEVGGKSLSANERQTRDSSPLNRMNGSHHHHHHKNAHKNPSQNNNNNSESRKNVWNYLIQQQEQETAAQRRIHADDPTELDDEDDDDEEEHLNGSGELEENDLQRQEQLINFRAKLSAFENLSKSDRNSCVTTGVQGGRDLSSSASSSASSCTSGQGGNQGVTLKNGHRLVSPYHHQLLNGKQDANHASHHEFESDSVTTRMEKMSTSCAPNHTNGITSSTKIVINGNKNNRNHHQMPHQSGPHKAVELGPQRQSSTCNSMIIHHQREVSFSSSNGSSSLPHQLIQAPQAHPNLLPSNGHHQVHPSLPHQHAHQVIHPTNLSTRTQANHPMTATCHSTQHHDMHGTTKHLSYNQPQSHVRSHSQQLLFDQQNQYANQPTPQHYYVLEQDGRTGQTIVVQEPLYSNQQPPPGSTSNVIMMPSSGSNPVFFPKPCNSQAPKKPMHALPSNTSCHGIDPRIQHQPHPGMFNPQTSHVTHSVMPNGGYNKNHWLIQEAELRRQIQTANNNKGVNVSSCNTSSSSSSSSVSNKKSPPTSLVNNNDVGTNGTKTIMTKPEQIIYENFQSSAAPSSTGIPLHPLNPLQQQHHLQQSSQHQKQSMLSVSGRKKCSSCTDELGRGCAAMVIESLSLYYHINCFRCSVCHIQLGNGTCGTDVRVRNHKLHCNNCYSNDEEGLKFSRV